MRSTLGIAELQSRQTSPLHAMRCARVPCARLALEDSVMAIAINTACRAVHGANSANHRFMSILPIRALEETEPYTLPPATGIQIQSGVHRYYIGMLLIPDSMAYATPIPVERITLSLAEVPFGLEPGDQKARGKAGSLKEWAH